MNEVPQALTSSNLTFLRPSNNSPSPEYLLEELLFIHKGVSCPMAIKLRTVATLKLMVAAAHKNLHHETTRTIAKQNNGLCGFLITTSAFYINKHQKCQLNYTSGLYSSKIPW
jgi:hypothetical protein